MDELEARASSLETRFDQADDVIGTLLPWVGADGQLRVRLERLEQAVLALISDPNNPASSAQKAQDILTRVPVPQA